MIKPEDFREVGERLSIGKSVRVPHWCGEGRVMIVSRKDEGISAHCFRCNDNGWISSRLSLAERIERLDRLREEEGHVSPELPRPIERDVREWPRKARVWLYKAGIGNDYIRRLGIYWCPRLERVVLPMHESGEIVYWQARNPFDDGRAKYINPKVPRPTPKFGQGPVLVLTEDYLSAAKVGLVTEAWSLLGTSIDESQALDVLATGKPVLVGLDPDPPGRRGAAKVTQMLRLFGVQAAARFMDRDPKLHSRREIQKWLANFTSELSQ